MSTAIEESLRSEVERLRKERDAAVAERWTALEQARELRAERWSAQEQVRELRAEVERLRAELEQSRTDCRLRGHREPAGPAHRMPGPAG